MHLRGKYTIQSFCKILSNIRYADPLLEFLQNHEWIKSLGIDDIIELIGHVMKCDNPDGYSYDDTEKENFLTFFQQRFAYDLQTKTNFSHLTKLLHHFNEKDQFSIVQCILLLKHTITNGDELCEALDKIQSGVTCLKLVTLVEEQWISTSSSMKDKYSINSFCKMLGNIPSSELKSFLQNHGRLKPGMISPNEIIQLSAQIIAWQKVDKEDLLNFICDLIQSDLKSEFTFKDFISLLDVIKSNSLYSVRESLASIMKDIITNGDELCEVTNRVFDTISACVKYVESVEEEWLAQFKSKCRMEFMTGCVDEEAHSYAFFKAINKDAMVITNHIFEMADMGLRK